MKVEAAFAEIKMVLDLLSSDRAQRVSDAWRPFSRALGDFQTHPKADKWRAVVEAADGVKAALAEVKRGTRQSSPMERAALAKPHPKATGVGFRPIR